MSGLAIIASQMGADVTGSDQKASIFTHSLAAFPQVVLSIGHHASNVPTDAELIYSSAIRPDNPELALARSRGLRTLHRSQLIAELTTTHYTIAVAGAHGKTTTSALLSHILTAAGLDPTYLVGGLMRPPALHARQGAGAILVIEADESDLSLLNYSVDLAVVTNVDLDHVGDLAAFRDRADVTRVISDFVQGAGGAVMTSQAASEVQAGDTPTHVVLPAESEQGFSLEGESYTLTLPGSHNVSNASLAVAVAQSMRCAPAVIQRGLTTFPGLARRFELKGYMGSGATVYDDYAHHPAEVAAAITAAHALTRGRVIAVFQPHLFSRTRHFAVEFARSLELADLVYIEPVYAARENARDWVGVDSDLISAETAKSMPVIRDEEVLVQEITRTATRGDTVLLLGAGSVSRLADRLVSSVNPLDKTT